MIDKKGRLFGLINVVDLIVLLIVVLMAGRVVYTRLDVQEVVAPSPDELTIELRASSIFNEIGANIALGQKLHDRRTGVYLGEIVDFSVVPTPIAVAADGQLFWTESPRVSDISITLVNRGTAGADSYQVGALAMRNGDRLSVMGSLYSLDVVVTGLGRR